VVVWGDDGVRTELGDVADHVGYLPETLVLPSRELWQTLGLQYPADAPLGFEEMLREIGVWRTVRGFCSGLAARVGSLELTASEARGLALARLLLVDRSSLWILDQPLDGLSRRRARCRLKEILRRAGQRTVVLSMSRAVSLECFDRVLVLSRGRIAYDGPPSGGTGSGEAAA
jgi:ABC-type transport system involved in cytochrome bd biosynthesis fused ATPase/permease subunit